ncbi:condensation protein [Paracoccus jeotgali]|uniref:Condensation protein n=2 Tax=Paracoccus jeotgali TaxID=2065379 RepID=A0A2K9MI99_9RHOB|nr:condensation protein [Paracoccus jeotgali]
MTMPIGPTEDFDDALAPDAGSELLPCSATQERFWFLDRMDPGNLALNIAFRWNVSGKFSAAAFEAAFKGVIARHEILRTRYLLKDGRPVQQIMPSAPFHLSEIDIRNTPQAEQEDRIDAIAMENARMPFDLAQPGLLRATLIRLSNDRALLAITVHHICFDGWSIGVLGREVGQLAAAFQKGVTADLPELPLQYGDYALWQREYAESAPFAAELAPWHDRLRDAPYFELEPDFPRSLQRSPACALVTTELPPAFGERLRAAARARSMSPFGYGAAVLSALLSRLTGAPEVLFGSQVAGRSEVDLEPLIGVFIDNVILRFDTAQNRTMALHLDHVRETLQDTLTGHPVPFNKLVEIANPPRDPSRTPLISINFILQQVFMETARYGDFELSSSPSQAPGAIYDLNFVLIGRASGWRMTLEHSTDLFDRKTAQDLLAAWLAAFQFAFDGEDRLLSDLPLIPIGPQARAETARRLDNLEAVLTAHRGVSAAAAVRYRGDDGSERLHAFVAPDRDAPPMPLEALPRALAEHLDQAAGSPDRPDGISVLLDLPRDRNGNIARHRLPLPEAAAATTYAPTPAAPAPSPMAAAADIEARLAAIWSDLLGLDNISPSANFFDLGGHSLLTVRMLVMIEREFGRRLSLATIYHVPTLRALAQHLASISDKSEPEEKADPAEDRLWRVQPLIEAGEGIPLIAINNAQMVFELARGMSVPRPVLSVRMFEKHRGAKLTPRPFQEIATECIEAIRSAQPHGPYALFGICVHGNLAIEVARQLQAAGEEVAAVILKDVWEPAYAASLDDSRSAAILGRLHFLKTRLRLVLAGEQSLSAFLGTFRLVRKTGLLTAGVKLGLIERVRNTDMDQEQEEFVNYLTDARNVHRPDPYDGTVLHFVTRETPTRPPFDPEMGWARLVTGRLVTQALPQLYVGRRAKQGIDEAARRIEDLLSAAEDAGAKPGTASAQGQGQNNVT